MCIWRIKKSKDKPMKSFCYEYLCFCFYQIKILKPIQYISVLVVSRF